MKSCKKWLDAPITWGGYFKLAGICTVIGTAISAVSMVMLLEPTWWRTIKDFWKRSFDK